MLDPVLRGLAGAENDEEAERQLEQLLERRVGPLVRTIVGSKLRTYSPGRVVAVEDLEDVAGDALLVLVKRLQALRERPPGFEIENLDDYAASIAYILCAHYLRRRYPERSRLKNRLRYVLSRDGRFALWEAAGTGLVCGLRSWRGRSADVAALEKLDALEGSPERWPDSWTRPPVVERADPVPLIAGILDRAEGPVDFDRLVSLVASIWRVERIRQPNPDRVFDRLAAADPSKELSIDRRRFVERVWAEVQQLPVRQRTALLLNLRSTQGSGMLWVFPALGVASLRVIAAALEMPLRDLAALWSRLPLEDNALAEQLGCTRQQVINLRMSARKRLSNRLGMRESSSEARAGGGVMSRPFPHPWKSTSE
jgi:RNA polymerase sigma factor (sigma-70 family)